MPCTIFDAVLTYLGITKCDNTTGNNVLQNEVRNCEELSCSGLRPMLKAHIGILLLHP